jgi:RNA polymerase sigma-70 factor (ECF subfamily)
MNSGSDDLIPTRHSLLSRLKDCDDQESWRDFFDTYWKLIYGVAIKSGMSDDEAQEVVQETVIAVAKKIPEFKTDPAFGSFKAWLLNLTRWRIADQLRKRQRQGRAQQHRSDRTSTNSTTSTIGKIQDPAGFELEHLWDEEWEKNLIDAAIEKVKRQVNPRHYQMFYLHVIKKQSVQQVVRSLGVNAGQIYLAKHRIGGLIKKEIKNLETKLV